MQTTGKTILALFLLGFLLSPQLAARAFPSDHDHHDHQQHHAANSVGLSLGYVHLDPEEESTLSIHLHYMRHLQGDGLQRFIGVGFGFETILADETHLNPMFTLGIFPWRGLEINISPGLLITKHDGDTENLFSTHVEAGYGFHLGGLEVGPMLGFALAGDDRHYMIGVHLAKGF